MRKISLLAALVCAATALAQEVPVQRLAPKARLQARATAADTRVNAYITTTGDADWAALEALGVRTVVRLDSVATAIIPVSKLQAVAAVKGVSYIQTTSTVVPMLDLARTEAGADKVSAGTGLSQAYTGAGVVVGVVDAGFDYTHKAFYDNEGQLRIKRVWEQSGTSTNYSAPEKYGYGVELTTPEAITTASGDITDNSHGTHVTGIAAGNDDYLQGAYRGTAPDADIVLVSMGESSRDNVNLTNAIAYIFDYAESVGKPCVVNLSLGNHAGPHDGTSTFDVMADALQGEGRLIVGASGNHRTDQFHVSKTFNGSGDDALRTLVAFKTKPSVSSKGGDVEIWGSVGAEFEVVLSAYKVTNGNEDQQTVVYPSNEAVQTVSLGNNFTGTLSVTSETSPLNGKPHVLISSDLTGIRSNYFIALTVRPKGAGTIDIWADDIYTELTSKDKEGFTGPNTTSTIAEIGGTAKRILTVGAYTTRNEYTLSGSTTSTTLDSETIADLSSFSSYGPTADGRQKPEVTAPGCLIVSAVSQNDNSGTLLVAQSYSDGSRIYQYGYMQGTSMAAPFVTGVVATWLQACPALTPEQLKQVVSQTARTDAFTAAPAEGWGYGKIDAYEGLKKCLDLSANGIATVARPFTGNITLTDGAIRVQPLTDGTTATATIYTRDGMMVSSTPVSGDTLLPTSGLDHGIYLLKVSDASGVKTLKFAR